MRNSLLALLASSAFLSLAAAPAMADAPKDWTLLVYLNGNNNLDSFGALNINQMEKVGSTKDVNVVVQWASLEAKTTKRLLVKKDNDTTHVTSPTVQDIGNVDMGDWRTLADFIAWGAAKYPAKHYLVDVWDHGSGWHAVEAIKALGTRATAAQRSHALMHMTDISWDDNTGHSITTAQLGAALEQAAKAIGRKIDVYGSDACLMAMAEVAQEVSSAATYYVGSEETEPGAGWPYDTILARWTAGHQEPADVSKIIAEEYAKSYNNGENGSSDVTFSAFDLSKLPELDAAVGAFGAELSKANAASRAKVVTSINSTQSFAFSDYGDLLDFLDALDKNQAVDAKATAPLRQAAQQFVISSHATGNFNGRAKGVSIWLPNTKDSYESYSDAYAALHFDASTHWGNALRYLLQDASR